MIYECALVTDSTWSSSSLTGKGSVREIFAKDNMVAASGTERYLLGRLSRKTSYFLNLYRHKAS